MYVSSWPFCTYKTGHRQPVLFHQSNWLIVARRNLMGLFKNLLAHLKHCKTMDKAPGGALGPKMIGRLRGE